MKTIHRSIWALLAGALVALSACSDDEKTCQDFCGAGAACVGGECVAVEPCTPACGEGTVCQGSGAGAACVPLLESACAAGCEAGQVCLAAAGAAECVAVCGAGQEWDAGTRTCVALACTPACGPCQACDLTDPAAPVCRDTCDAGATCDAQTNTCVAVVQFHANTDALAGPFASAYEVSARCVACHPQQAQDFRATIHWAWAGPTPQLEGWELDGTIGKQTLVNNFCVAVPSNEKRCDQCHAGFGGDPDPARPQKSARAYTTVGGDSSIPLEHRIDCLVCHSDPVSGYAKDPKNFGLPTAATDLARAAQLIKRTPTRTNCGVCHFYAGGGDNVKLMGSSLKNPPPAIDVHMGNGMDCAGCHAEPGHQFKGAGIHVPANVARTSCEDCHGAEPHEGRVQATGTILDGHAVKIACQTCHIPAFSRGQFAKMDWDWSTSGDNSRGTAGVVRTAVNDLGQPDPAGTSVVTYDFIKGDFLWQRNVTPAYAWYDGRMSHVTTRDRGAFTAETGLTAADADRITLGAPLGARGAPGAKIHPFKLMRGRQAFYVNGDESFAIVPNVFGPGSFWGVVQSAGYLYTPASGTYVTTATPAPAPLEGLWSTAFAKGAIAAGQLPSGTTIAKLDPATPAAPGWDWRYTKLYMDLNHEVAPKAEALGTACSDCHSATPRIPFQELGYPCPDPMLTACP